MLYRQGTREQIALAYAIRKASEMPRADARTLARVRKGGRFAFSGNNKTMKKICEHFNFAISYAKMKEDSREARDIDMRVRAYIGYADPAGLKMTQREREDARIAHRRAEYNRSVQKGMRDALVSACDYSAHTYTQANSRWAGGERYNSVSVGKTADAWGEADRRWSENGKWSGNDSCLTFQIEQDSVDTIIAHNIQIVAGLVTLSAQKIAPRVFRAAWVKQGRGFDLTVARGFIIYDHHVESTREAPTRAMIKKVRAMRSQTAANLRAKRIDEATLRSVYVQLSDSIEAGNCESQTSMFRDDLYRKYNIQGEAAVRADIVLAFAKTRHQEQFAMRAIAHAKVNH